MEAEEQYQSYSCSQFAISADRGVMLEKALIKFIFFSND